MTRVGFNAGDRFFWRDKPSYVAFTDTLEQWPNTLASLMDQRGITDILLYGNTRPIHAEAVVQAKAKGIPNMYQTPKKF